MIEDEEEVEAEVLDLHAIEMTQDRTEEDEAEEETTTEDQEEETLEVGHHNLRVNSNALKDPLKETDQETTDHDKDPNLRVQEGLSKDLRVKVHLPTALNIPDLLETQKEESVRFQSIDRQPGILNKDLFNRTESIKVNIVGGLPMFQTINER